MSLSGRLNPTRHNSPLEIITIPDDMDLREYAKILNLEYCVWHSGIHPNPKESASFLIESGKKGYNGYDEELYYKFIWNNSDKRCYDNCNHNGRLDDVQRASIEGSYLRKQEGTLLEELIKIRKEKKEKIDKCQKSLLVIKNKILVEKEKFDRLETGYFEIEKTLREQIKNQRDILTKAEQMFRDNIENKVFKLRVDQELEGVRVLEKKYRKLSNSKVFSEIKEKKKILEKMKCDMEIIKKEWDNLKKSYNSSTKKYEKQLKVCSQDSTFVIQQKKRDEINRKKKMEEIRLKEEEERKMKFREQSMKKTISSASRPSQSRYSRPADREYKPRNNSYMHRRDMRMTTAPMTRKTTPSVSYSAATKGGYVPPHLR